MISVGCSTTSVHTFQPSDFPERLLFFITLSQCPPSFPFLSYSSQFKYFHFLSLLRKTQAVVFLFCSIAEICYADLCIEQWSHSDIKPSGDRNQSLCMWQYMLCQWCVPLQTLEGRIMYGSMYGTLYVSIVISVMNEYSVQFFVPEILLIHTRKAN